MCDSIADPEVLRDAVLTWGLHQFGAYTEVTRRRPRLLCMSLRVDLLVFVFSRKHGSPSCLLSRKFAEILRTGPPRQPEAY